MERTGLSVFHCNISKNVALSLGLNTSYLIVVNKPHVAGLRLNFLLFLYTPELLNHLLITK